MSFTHPAYLWGLMALAIPIIIHLFNFKRFKKVWFTNVKLIRQLSEETRRQSKLRHLIILLLRLLAIAALVMIFAGPFIPNKDMGASGGEKKLVSIYLDNSFSMEMRDSENVLLETAKNMIPDITGSFTGEDVFRFITNDMKSEHNHLMSAEEVVEHASKTQLSPTSVALSVVLDRFREVPQDAAYLHQEIFVLSDMQRSTMDLKSLEKDSTTKVRIITLEAENHNNIYTDSCWFENPVHLVGKTLKMNVRIVNNSDKTIEKAPVRLLIDKKQKALTTINLPASGSATTQFVYIENTPGTKKAEVVITDFPVTYDDSYFFTYDVIQNVSVLLVNGTQENRYLKTLFSSDSTFHLTNISAGQLSPTLVAANDLIIFNESGDPGSGMASELFKHCSTGKGVVIIPGQDQDQPSLAQVFQLNSLSSPDTGRIRVSEIQTRSSFFDNVFNIDELDNKILPAKTDFPIIKRYYRQNASAQSDESLMSMANGESFLMRKKIGGGWVYRFNCEMDEKRGNFVHHALFVPVFYRMAYLSLPQAKHAVTIGTDTHISVTTNNIDPEGSEISSENGDFMFIPGIERRGSSTLFQFYGNITEAGFYTISQKKTVVENNIHEFAANYNRKESDLSYYTTDEAEAILDELNMENITILQTPPDKLHDALKTLNHGRQLWRYFVYLCLLFLLAEVILLRIWK